MPWCLWPGATTLVRDDLFRACSGSNRAKALLLAVFPFDCVPVMAATACLVLRDPAAALSRRPPWRRKLQCLALVAALCIREPPSASTLASIRLPVWFSVRLWLLRLQSVSASTFAQQPAPAPVLQMTAPVRGGCGRCRPGSGIMFDVVFIRAGRTWTDETETNSARITRKECPKIFKELPLTHGLIIDACVAAARRGLTSIA